MHCNQVEECRKSFQFKISLLQMLAQLRSYQFNMCLLFERFRFMRCSLNAAGCTLSFYERIYVSEFQLTKMVDKSKARIDVVGNRRDFCKKTCAGRTKIPFEQLQIYEANTTNLRKLVYATQCLLSSIDFIVTEAANRKVHLFITSIKCQINTFKQLRIT